HVVGGLQGVHAILVHGVGVPAVQSGSPINSLPLLEVVGVGGLGDVFVGVGHVDIDGLHGAVSEDGAGISSPDGQVAVRAVIADDEQVVQSAFIQIHSGGIAILVELGVVAVVSHETVVVLVQNIRVIVGLHGTVVLGAAGGQAGVQALAGDAIARLVIIAV